MIKNCALSQPQITHEMGKNGFGQVARWDQATIGKNFQAVGTGSIRSKWEN